MGTVIIFEKTGQTISYVPPARASNPTYKIENFSKSPDDAGRIIAEGNATNPDWTITSSAAAGVDQRNPAKISTASTTGPSIGDACSIVAPDGTRETFRLKGKSTNVYLLADTGLANNYPSQSTVYGIEFSASFPDGTAADEDILTARDDLRVTWTFVVDGETSVVTEPLQFVRREAGTTAYVGDATVELRTLYPDMPGRLAEGGDFDKIVEKICEKVANDLRRNGKEPELFLMGPQGIDLIVARMMVLGAAHAYAPGATVPDRRWREEKQAEYAALLAAMVAEDPGAGVVSTDHETDTAEDLPTTASHSRIVNTAYLIGISHIRDL